MKENILYLIMILTMCQGIFAMQLNQAIEDYRNKINEAKRYVDRGEIQKAWTIFQEGHELYTLDYATWNKMSNNLREYIIAATTRQVLNEFWALQYEIQQLINQGKFEEAQDKYNKLKAAYDNIKARIPSKSIEVYESAIVDLEKALFQAQLKDVQQFANQGKYKEAYDLLNKLKDLSISTFEPSASEIKKVEESLIQLQLKDVQQLANQGKYKEAYDLLNKLKALEISTFEPSASEIKKVEESLVQPQLKDVQQLADQHKYTEAYAILNRLRELQIRSAAILEIKIKQQEAAWKKAQEPVAPVEQKWLFIKQIPGAESVEKTDWKIQDQKLLLNLDATELMTQETFTDLIKQAKDKNLPFILVMVQSGDPTKFFPYFFGVDVLISFMEDWRSEEKFEDKFFKNPVNREKVTNIGIYVMGDDKTLHLLKDKADISYLEKLIDYKGHIYEPNLGRRIHNYEFKPELTEPGVAKTFINNLYKEQGKPALFNL